jgi:pimeloyl-ACP methyl ester carboxylesterase
VKHLIAVLLLAMLAACQHAPPRGNLTPEQRQRLEAIADGLDGTDPAVGWTSDPALVTPEAVFLDPPRDAAHPARNVQLVIPSGPVRPELGRPAEMNALFLLAAGEGPHPTMLLLHGLPGNERNLDLAQAVRRAGWNVLTFTYRGAWGSEGTFSIQHAIDDAATALAFLRSREAFERYQVNPNRIVLAGHSMGGMAALITAVRDPFSGTEKCGRYHWAAEPIAGLILLDACNAGATARRLREGGTEARAAFIAGLDDLGHALGPITAADLADELIRRGEPWELEAAARNQPGLCRDEPPAMPVLTVYATHGLAAENRALAAAMREARRGRGEVTEREIDTDHAFADARVRLSTEVVRWLQGRVPGS